MARFANPAPRGLAFLHSLNRWWTPRWTPRDCICFPNHRLLQETSRTCAPGEISGQHLHTERISAFSETWAIDTGVRHAFVWQNSQWFFALDKFRDRPVRNGTRRGLMLLEQMRVLKHRLSTFEPVFAG